ncbi:ABC transporter ATP-binding protein [Acanthopleuribacter pedis]|uniref:ABC transporter ATP-binding protein n=1 Tax=Acanthopleuribacter pedis TaxID=442870 RepID=A0A8J7Q3G6_9BACT|nr:ABC transporter ATP-binding protein [Acanthopleuribacter pedis]MBO1317263.1 ABC transporter ATP-binding protein [Acanthopleuribacter pedis]MBO1318570.1 ABC transporter ATP-binding protein [Acanthopleuribacter pedis]
MNDTNPMLHLEDVYMRYPSRDGTPITILNDIDLKVRQGEFITVVGPSGCGKSTLLRLILGAESPTEGAVLLDGKKLDAPNRNRGIVFQKYSLFPHLSVMDNIVFGLDAEAHGMFLGWLKPGQMRQRRRAFRDQAQVYLERIGLADAADKYPHELSGGMRQRVAIAQSLIMKPRILLMDEPFGALDHATRTEMQLFILEQWEQAEMTIFFVTHDLEEACFLGSRVLVLSQYYQTDAGRGQGAKIVGDFATPGGHPKPTDFLYSEEMSQLVHRIRSEGLSPDNLQHIRDFNLTHRDAFRTVNPEEWQREQ